MGDQEQKEMRRLYRACENRVFGGVCAGIAQYFEVDVVIIRILFVLLALMQGAGILVYFVAWIIMPACPPQHGERKETVKKSGSGSQNALLFVGIVLVLIGAYYTLTNFVYFPDYFIYTFPFRMHWDLFWPVLLILIGIFYLVHVSQKKNGETPMESTSATSTKPPSDRKRLLRTRSDRKLAGVCSGIAGYFDIDPTLIRIAWIVLSIFLGAVFLGVVAYIVMAIVVPEGEYETTDQQ